MLEFLRQQIAFIYDSSLSVPLRRIAWIIIFG
jgi:hypothetical protein